MAGIGTQIAEYSSDFFWNQLFSSSTPDKVNVKDSFASFLHNKQGLPLIKCAEDAEKSLGNILIELNHQQEKLASLGLNGLVHFNQHGLAITWRHHKFIDISGSKPPPSGFGEICSWVSDLRGIDFLLPCAAFLFCLGCDKIFLTDGPGDGGADLIGTGSSLANRNIAWIVQAKSAKNKLKRETLLADYAKFTILPQLPVWEKYMKALGLDISFDGRSAIFLFASNLEFKDGFISVARSLNSIIRSGRQVAYFLAERASLTQWKRAFDEIGEPKANINRNLAGFFKKVL